MAESGIEMTDSRVKFDALSAIPNSFSKENISYFKNKIFKCKKKKASINKISS